MTTLVPASVISAVATPESYGAIGDGSTDDTAGTSQTVFWRAVG